MLKSTSRFRWRGVLALPITQDQSGREFAKQFLQIQKINKNREPRRVGDSSTGHEQAKREHRRRIEPQGEKRAETVEAEQQQQPAMTPEDMAKIKYGVAEKFSFCTRWDCKRVLEWLCCEIPCHFVL
ncbi:hypothetical protein CAEBREN_23035 [Caenorhabditis brenneri]|uniref:Uncharacterized protein n=1 Tax=Caenorhabditis brenneri TaxID=135651 RepID=G0P7T5_CAEBE|nr:hypothetical protein CAEBREN_23035 [Caenorhabditis brenneri]